MRVCGTCRVRLNDYYFTKTQIKRYGSDASCVECIQDVPRTRCSQCSCVFFARQCALEMSRNGDLVHTCDECIENDQLNQCFACRIFKGEDFFSTTQFHRHGHRARCRQCVENNFFGTNNDDDDDDDDDESEYESYEYDEYEESDESDSESDSDEELEHLYHYDSFASYVANIARIAQLMQDHPSSPPIVELNQQTSTHHSSSSSSSSTKTSQTNESIECFKCKKTDSVSNSQLSHKDYQLYLCQTCSIDSYLCVACLKSLKKTAFDDVCQTKRTELICLSCEEIHNTVARVRVTSSKHFDGTHMCHICMERPRCVAFSPCGHVAACAECARQSKGQCFVCRAPAQLLHLFVA